MNSKRNPLPPIPEILFLTVFVFLSVFHGNGMLADGDTGYHIRAGQYILKNLSIPYEDIFSFHTPALAWTAHEWLSEVIMAITHDAFGLTGVVVLFSFLLALTYYLLFQKINSDNGNMVAAIVITVLAILTSGIHWLARPHVFSLLIAVLWYWVLDSYQKGRKTRLYLLPLLMIAWANLHGGYILGIMLTCIYIFSNILTYFTTKDEGRKQARERAKNLFFVLIASFIAATVNPYGFHILLFPFKLTSNKFIMDNVKEFLSPDFHNVLVFKYMLLLLIPVLGFSRKRLTLIELLIVGLFTNMALYSIRHITLFAIFVAPVMARHITYIINDLDDISPRLSAYLRTRSDGYKKLNAASFKYVWMVAGCVAVIAYFGFTGRTYEFSQSRHTEKAVTFLKSEKLPGNMFNHDEIGDYMIYRVWPEYKVFFDGRSDMYGTDMIKEYLSVTQVQPGMDKVLEKYDVNWIIYTKGSALSRSLSTRDDWRLIYTDDKAVIFIKNTRENAELIEKYKDVWQ